MAVQEEYTELTFAQLNLDARLVDTLATSLDITKATLIQEKAIPLALLGKDILARAKTGSGKTFAYLLPIFHGILQRLPCQGTVAVIIVPTKELANQVEENVRILSASAAPSKITHVNLAKEEEVKDRLPSLLKSQPNIVVSTPSRLSDNCEHVTWTGVKYFVIDEADYILSFGYSEDLDKIIPMLPKVKQSFLMSATMSEEIENIKSLILRNAVVLKLEMGEDDQNLEGGGQKLEQFTIHISEESDKFLLAFAIFKLGLLKGKMILFVNECERGYKLKIFLEQFGVRACCVNPDFPLSCRQHVIEQFNRGVYDILIAPDISTGGTTNAKSEKSRESGMARGVDFKRVDVVINFDYPGSVDAYVHRIGRTARAGQSGTAISFITSEQDMQILDLTRAEQQKLGRVINDYAFDLALLDGYRYRMNDALRAVTRAVIKDTQMAELKAELANSEKLKTILPSSGKSEELSRLLRHDRKTTVRQQPHLKHIPEYLKAGSSSTALPQTRPNPIIRRSNKVGKPQKGKRSSKSTDPLKKKK
jgi:ATP-dependent RNA helicase DDX56/DBP9